MNIMNSYFFFLLKTYWKVLGVLTHVRLTIVAAIARGFIVLFRALGITLGMGAGEILVSVV